MSVATLGAAYSDYTTAKQKVDRIESDQLKAGTRVELTVGELNAYLEKEAPPGIRNAKVRLISAGVASGTALVDFGKLQRAQGYQPGWLMSKLLDGEHPISVTAQIRSGGGHATVDVQKVQISGVVVDGRTLDFLIQNFVIPMYPEATVGRPFEMGHHIDKLDVRPASVAVLIGH